MMTNQENWLDVIKTYWPVWVQDDKPSIFRSDAYGTVFWLKKGHKSDYRLRVSETSVRIYHGKDAVEPIFEWDISNDPFSSEGFESVMKAISAPKGGPGVRYLVGKVATPNGI